MPVLQLVLGNIFFGFAFLAIHAFTRKVIVSSKLINKIMKNGKKMTKHYLAQLTFSHLSWFTRYSCNSHLTGNDLWASEKTEQSMSVLECNVKH